MKEGITVYEQDPAMKKLLESKTNTAHKRGSSRSILVEDIEKKKEEIEKQHFFTENDPSMRQTKAGLPIIENSLELRSKHSRKTYAKMLEHQQH